MASADGSDVEVLPKASVRNEVNTILRAVDNSPDLYEAIETVLLGVYLRGMEAVLSEFPGLKRGKNG